MACDKEIHDELAKTEVICIFCNEHIDNILLIEMMLVVKIK